VEEIEALTAIYNDDLKVVNESKREYEIKVCKDEQNDKYIVLQFTLPDDYPTSSPPQYQLKASWLSKDERRVLDNGLADIFIENMGDSIIYLWIEKIREFLQEILDDANHAGAVNDIDVIDEQLEEEERGDVVNYEDFEDYKYEYTGKYEKKTQEMETSNKCPEILHGEFVHDRKSVFQAHLAPVHSEEEVQLVMEKLLENRKVAAATHNIQAYRICKEGKHTVWYQDCKDDGEIHAGNRILHLMEILEATNVLVVITRWYGGIHLGPDRFKHINCCARNILEQGGYIKNKVNFILCTFILKSINFLSFMHIIM
ncbi:hypothetical protein LOTGIDRAFT_129058, partial [Lottia gigantea]